ncbi:hypothetical protein ISN34_04015 [Xanthomonas translucens pv. translucens]|uniref:DUF202 domain-containing protein n=1 Tax=Xanthomonas translucens pv. translucens TaxID=134875 RepID=A0ABW9KZ92_XANCT|nr:hypothetical protein [Xanthomonas translucens]QSQ33009.1 hypothetical protein ISN31_14115 [Xanthomonas translucens pv. translucens]QSQ46072.1 hypothetical protein ISN34_04015 [Xanthomonas translucens pv. translucens]
MTNQITERNLTEELERTERRKSLAKDILDLIKNWATAVAFVIGGHTLAGTSQEVTKRTIAGAGLMILAIATIVIAAWHFFASRKIASALTSDSKPRRAQAVALFMTLIISGYFIYFTSMDYVGDLRKAARAGVMSCENSAR